MAAGSRECDRNRLRFSLEDRLSDVDQSELAEHLEGCTFCRQELERLAASSEFWGDAPLLREGAELDPPTVGLGPISFLADDEVDENPAGTAWLRLLDPPEPDRDDILGRLGAYEILQVLGQGGMGVVLKAHDPALDRTVAIKVLTPALAHAATARKRFAREARAAAAVGHEHIVAIHAVDEFRGLPYLVMQYIPGRSLQERLDASGPLEVKEILRIGTQAARALAAAHTQGVVHRDIKPANILLENCVERVKLTDFGLARAIDDASVTQSGVVAGTPQYMAPEQARGEPVDARADLFSLGAVLYAMAAGRPPFRADSAMAVLKRVCDDHHHSIRELNPDVPDWLESVIDHLLAKDPADRFQSATEVAEILESGLAHLQQPTAVPRPSVALAGSAVRTGDAVAVRTADPTSGVPSAKSPRRPPGRLAIATGLLRIHSPLATRHSPPRSRLAIAAGLLLLAMAGLGASEASGLTQVSEFVATVLRIKTLEGTLVVNVDDPSVKVDIDDETVIIGGAGPQEIRLRIGKHHIQATRNGQPVKDEMVTILKGKKEIVSIGFEPTPNLAARKPETPGPVAAPRSHETQCMGCHVVRPGVSLGPLPAKHPHLIRNLDQGARGGAPGFFGPAPMWHAIRSRATVRSLAFSPDGRLLAMIQQGAENPLRIWDSVEKREVACIAGHNSFQSVAFSPDGKTLVAGGVLGEMVLIDTKTGALRQLERDQDNLIGNDALAFLPDGKTIVAGSCDGRVRFRNIVTQVERSRLHYPGGVLALALSPDGSSLAVAGYVKIIQVYDLTTGRLKATLKGHANNVNSLDFSPDGRLLASAGLLTVRIWDTATWQDAGHRIHRPTLNLCVRFSPDGKLLAISDGNGTRSCVMLWDVSSWIEVRNLEGHTNGIQALAFSPDGKTLASGSMDQTLKLWDVATGILREDIVPGETGYGENTKEPKVQPAKR